MDREELQREIDGLQWYHSIDLGGGVVTPGLQTQLAKDNWAMVRRLMDRVDFQGKRVADLGSRDGMWAFEAEKRGAEFVHAVEIEYDRIPQFNLCKQILNSNVFYYYGLDVNNLSEMFYDDSCDVVQHFGLLYHLKNPFRSLEESRKVLKTGGTLLLETLVLQGSNSSLNFNKPCSPYINDSTTYWIPTIGGAVDMLCNCNFRHIPSSIEVIDAVECGPMLGRVCMEARAI